MKARAACFPVVLCVVTLTVVAHARSAGVTAQPAVGASEPPSRATRADRLAALSPDNPLAYFELAEEIAAAPIAIDDRDLARTLFVLAAVLAAEPASAGPRKAETTPDWLASSACLALVSLAESEPERRWLRAMAGSLTPEESRAAAQRASSASSLDAPAQELAAALDSLRAGQGQRAAKLLERPGVSDLLDRYERLLTSDGRPGGAARIRSLVSKFPYCRECRNERVTRDREGTHLCSTCGGRPGPKVEGEELVGQLRLESLLVNGIQRSWAAQTIADGGAPLRELDMASLADAFGVDPARRWWRQGHWVESADGRRRPEPQPQTPEPAGS
ncbi:MAG: hypothetical protein IT438_03670 [Phycisphaerales bacterium]|nr:hypothetical protein [Phycisphaerales bacterium]